MIRLSFEKLVAPNQIAWLYFPEGQCEIAAKVIRDPRSLIPYISLPTAYRKGVAVEVIFYPEKKIWEKRAAELLGEFRRRVGEDYYFGKINDCGILPSVIIDDIVITTTRARG